MATKEVTNASVAALPTPSAPAVQLKPRWQPIRAIAAPKKTLLKTPAKMSSPPTYVAGVEPVVVRVDPEHLRC